MKQDLLLYIVLKNDLNFDSFFKIKTKKQSITLINGTEHFKAFLDPPATIHRKYYVFDVKNPKEIERGTSKPILTQKGPYVYTMVCLLNLFPFSYSIEFVFEYLYRKNKKEM